MSAPSQTTKHKFSLLQLAEELGKVFRTCQLMGLSLYEPVHAALDFLIERVGGGTSDASKPVAVCGEIAGDPQHVERLLRLGIRELYMPLAPARGPPRHRQHHAGLSLAAAVRTRLAAT